MYLIDCIILFLGLYVAPALACWPHLALRPKTAVTLPFVSAFILYIVAYVLKSGALFNPEWVRGLCLSFCLIAATRLSLISRNFKHWQWSLKDLSWLFLAILILLPYITKLGTHGFDNGDEIYSWNYWAIQHYLGQSPDFSHTGAPYPQLLPIWIAYGYQLLGNLELALPIKAMLGIFPLALVWMLLQLISKQSLGGKIVGLSIIATVLFGQNVQQYFDHAYADPLMASSLALSLFCYLQFRHTHKPDALLLTVITAIVAGVSKQAGLLWAFFALPVLLLSQLKHSNQKQTILMSIVALILAGMSWYSLEGAGFSNNDGVIRASMGERQFSEQFIHAAKTYLGYNPFILAIFALTSFCCLRFKSLRLLYLVWVLPSLALWFLFGSYHLRLGIHLLLGMAVICLYSLRVFKFSFIKGPLNARTPQRLLLVVALASISVCSVLLIRSPLGTNTKLSPYYAGEISLYKYFGKEYKIIEEMLYQKEATIWVPSRYLYGLFYQHAHVIEPNYSQWKQLDLDSLMNELKTQNPDYVIDAGPRVTAGCGSKLLMDAVKQCPNAFMPITKGPNRYDYKVYKFNPIALDNTACKTQ